ncbi:MAG: hypothetical protein KDA60_10235, partial [Planctomycetales bacterium]|nr:hypothetical protein [Planctomycetales bacterium]
GDLQTWPTHVQVNSQPVAVTQRDDRPSIVLEPGEYELTGDFSWRVLPQNLAIPVEIGLLDLSVNDMPVPIPAREPDGRVWLRRSTVAPAEQDQLIVDTYRVLEDGVPLWLQTQLVLSVSGKSREQELGWVLPEGWKISSIESPIPVAIDDQGRLKAQLRTGKWTLNLRAFRTLDVHEIKFADGVTPISPVELFAFRSNPTFRLVEVEGIPPDDASLTAFPTEWRDLPVYRWTTDQPIRLIEKLRGMGVQPPSKLTVDRSFWLDEDGHGATYVDRIQGELRNTLRLDAAPQHQLGGVRQHEVPMLITQNPQTGDVGIEVREQSLQLSAVGRVSDLRGLASNGWQVDADGLSITLHLPPGWRVLALFGPDDVRGDWLTSWTLLDLFLLLVFSIAVFRILGWKAGLLAFAAFGLAYHEPGAPRFTWLFVLFPLALLRVVPAGKLHLFLRLWKYVAVALLALCLVPHVVYEIRSALYPQLEYTGTPYRDHWILPWSPLRSRVPYTYSSSRPSYTTEEAAGEDRAPRAATDSNLSYAADATIQTGPGEPQWSWNSVHCRWTGPVTQNETIRPFLIPQSVHRLLCVVRSTLLIGLAALLIGRGKLSRPTGRSTVIEAVAVAYLIGLFVTTTCGVRPVVADEIPDAATLQLLRERLLEPDESFPHAAEIQRVELQLSDNQLQMVCEIHAATQTAIPLPGQVAVWSPVKVEHAEDPDVIVCRRGNYLWAVVPAGITELTITGLLPPSAEWTWTFELKPHYVTVDAPEWDVSGIDRNGVPEDQIFFVHKRGSTELAAEYDQRNLVVALGIERHLEIGHVWKVENRVVRLSNNRKAVAVRVPLLSGERVLSSDIEVEDGFCLVRLSESVKVATWTSELPMDQPIRLAAPMSDQWIERWHLATSPQWNATFAGLEPVFETQMGALIPVWHPWPSEEATLEFREPQAIPGPTLTVQRVTQTTELGKRQRLGDLQIAVVASLGTDLPIRLPSAAAVNSVQVGGKSIPIRQQGDQLEIPIRPGRHEIQVNYSVTTPLGLVAGADTVEFPVEATNVETTIDVPSARWVLWTSGPLRGPAVLFWTIAIVAILVAVLLGGSSHSPLRRYEWGLLAIGLTQVPLAAAMVVVAWLFFIAWRRRQTPAGLNGFVFVLAQFLLIILTFTSLLIFVFIVWKGLLDYPEMFIRGNGSYGNHLRWFQPRSGPMPVASTIVSVSVWYYRLLMLFWALWLAAALLHWLKLDWEAFSHGGCWLIRRARSLPMPATTESAEATRPEPPEPPSSQGIDPEAG